MSDLSMSYEKISDFISSLLFWFILVIKLRNFEYEINWNTLIFFDKKYVVSDLNMSHAKMSDFVYFNCLGLL